LEGAFIKLFPDIGSLFTAFVSGSCNVIAGEPVTVNEERVRGEGYTGEYTVGGRLFSKEPLAMMTRGDDVKFADFCNWVLQALFAAEAMNITQDRAEEFPSTLVFGDMYKDMFGHAIAAVGNYGEMYARGLESRIPRQGMNLINDGTNGMMYAHPFGNLEIENEVIDQIGPVANGTIEFIESNGYLRCAVVSGRPGFATFNETTQEWSGLDVDFCRAVSAAIFSTDEAHVEFLEVSETANGFSALVNGEIDLLAGAPYSLENDVLEPTTGMGFALSPSYYFSTNRSEALCLATREDDSQWSDFVRWSVWSTIYAEEAGLEFTDASEMPSVGLFGPNYLLMFRTVALRFGNYGYIYEENLRSLIPRSGANILNDGGSPQFNPWLSTFAN
jgi:ABC-type amino acid transport substrate-binding protein